MNNHRPDELSTPDLTLPHVEEAVLARFSDEDPDTDNLFEALKIEDPRLAWWLLREAQRLAPNITDKEKYAELALRLHGVLSAQILVNGLRRTFSLSTETPAAADDGDLPAPLG